MTRLATRDLSPAHKRLIGYAHPLREKVFTILTERPASPSEITRALGLDRKELSNVSHHVKYLVELGCAEQIGERQTKAIPEKIYKATERAIIDYGEWDELVRTDPAFAEYQVTRAMQVQLDDFTAAMKAGTVGKDEDFHLTRNTRFVDAEGFQEMMEENKRSWEAKDRIEQRSAERRDAAQVPIAVSDGLALFKLPPASQ